MEITRSDSLHMNVCRENLTLGTIETRSTVLWKIQAWSYFCCLSVRNWVEYSQNIPTGFQELIQFTPLPLILLTIHFIPLIINCLLSWWYILRICFSFGVCEPFDAGETSCVLLLLFGGCITWNIQPLLCSVKRGCSCQACEVLSWSDNIAQSGTKLALHFETVIHIITKYLKSEWNCWPPWLVFSSHLVGTLFKVTVLFHTSVLIALWT